MNREQRQPTAPGSNNPIIVLGMRVIRGELTLEQSLNLVSSHEFLKRLDDRTIANSDDLVNQIFEQQPQVALVFASLNYATARLSADDRLQTFCAFSLANIYNRLGRFPEALKLYREARIVFEKEGMRVDVARCDMNMAIVHEQQNLFHEAIKLYKEARVVFEENEMRVEVAMCDMNMAGVYEKQNLFHDALKLYQSALQKGDRIPEIVWKNRYGLGLVYNRQNRREEAYEHLNYAINTLETLRGTLPKEQIISPFFEDKAGVYQEMVDVCLNLQRCNEAIEHVERSKARRLLELLAMQDLKPQGTPQNLVEKYQGFRMKLRELQYRIEKGEDVRDKIKDAEARYNQTLEEIRVYDPDFTTAVRVEPITLRQIQDLLPDKETAIVEFFMTREHILAFVVTKGDISHKVIDGFTPQDLAEQWGRWIEGYLRFRHYGDRKGWFQTMDEVLERLYDKMFRQIKEVIPDPIRKLILIPYQFLHFFPLHALYREENGQRRYLIENYEEISYAPSASVLKRCKERGKRGRERLFAVSDPDGSLEYSRDEVETIQALFKEKLILGNPPEGKENGYGPATVERFLIEASQYNIIHIASHGLHDFSNPLMSSLRLYDKELPLWEIFTRLHIPLSWLVVLSACETGITELSRADEWVGLVSGFLHAGAPAVISSLWAVADYSTSFLMKKVYDNILGEEGRNGGMSVVQALNKVQRAFIRGEVTRETVEEELRQIGITQYPKTVEEEKAALDLSHPYYWAAFTVSGTS